MVNCDQKVHSAVSMTGFKKTREDGQCNVESPLVELGLRDHIIVAMSVVPEKTDRSEVRIGHQHHVGGDQGE